MPTQTKTELKKIQRRLIRHQKTIKKGILTQHQKAKKILQSSVDIDKIGEHGKRILAGSTLTGTLLLSSPASAPAGVLPEKVIEEQLPLPKTASPTQIKNILRQLFTTCLPQEITPDLGKNIEDKICQNLERILGIPVCTELEGERLNYQYGIMGYEQHLHRFPGDNASLHDEFPQEGIAPGLGAWGYFVASKDELTDKEIQMEKYYVAVQTLYLEDFPQRTQEIYDWYRYRKVLVINPQNCRAVVAVVGDAGPAKWTNKQFGGSPEVMNRLGLDTGMRNGKVLLLFVDDPNDEIPLGSVDFKNLRTLT
jgi:hypothetical protein